MNTLKKDLFIVTSAVRANMGVVDEETRLKQTIEGLQSLRTSAPNAIILLVDASPKPLDEATIMLLSGFVDRSISFFGDEDLMTLANAGLKSQAEITLLFKTLNILKQHPELQKMLEDVRRIFKLSGRTNMLNPYNPLHYNDYVNGKYVFKKSIPSWLPPQTQLESGCDHLYITRMYSFCVSLLDNYLDSLPKIYEKVNQYGVDTEHAHFGVINKNLVVEFNDLYCQGTMASTGLTETY